jgi:hypothetical protein
VENSGIIGKKTKGSSSVGSGKIEETGEGERIKVSVNVLVSVSVVETSTVLGVSKLVVVIVFVIVGPVTVKFSGGGGKHKVTQEFCER